MPDHRIFLRLHRQLREARSFYVTRHDDAVRQRAARNPRQEERILSVVAVRPESSTRVVAPHVSVSHETICRVLSENRLHLVHFQRIHALNPAGYLLQLPVSGIAMCPAAGLHSS
ncbi:hypothetical protein TNCV_4050101 [Trichonephila clavipes]|nr:hypothetical protein TNCV_4050101 [Trichonephila clavipes]